MSSPIQPLIKTENLSVIYDLGKSSETKALDNVNVEIYPREYAVFFGPSGSGKSTLLYSIAGLETPTYGKVYIQGRDIAQFSQRDLIRYNRRYVGMIFQAYYLIPSLSVLDNIVLPQILDDIPGKERKTRANILLERFGIQDQADKFPQSLSGGQQQRVAISRALINSPIIILADEPVGNLDSKSAQNFMELISELNIRDKRTVILVTHDPRYLSYAHRIYYMSDGKVVQEIVNREREQIVEKKATQRIPSQLERLARLYPYFSKQKLQARALANYLLLPLSAEQMERFENVLEEYIQHKISPERLLELLDLPYEEGGTGFYRQTARDYTSEIRTILDRAEALRGEFAREEAELLEGRKETLAPVRVREIRQTLFDTYQGQVTPLQLQRMDKIIEERMRGIADKNSFSEYLDTSIEKGGVGLNRRTARNFTRLIEIIIAESQ